MRAGGSTSCKVAVENISNQHCKKINICWHLTAEHIFPPETDLTVLIIEKLALMLNTGY